MSCHETSITHDAQGLALNACEELSRHDYLCPKGLRLNSGNDYKDSKAMTLMSNKSCMIQGYLPSQINSNSDPPIPNLRIFPAWHVDGKDPQAVYLVVVRANCLDIGADAELKGA